MEFTLKKMPYAYDALEPYIDAKTMEIHYTKHHETYCKKLNEAIHSLNIKELSIEQVLLQHGDNAAIRNNGGGYFNHTLFGNP